MDWSLGDRTTKIGFWVPTAIVLVATVVGFVVVAMDTSGYAGLLFIAYLIYGLPAILAWMIVGGFVVGASGPEGAWKRFVTGAGAAFGLAIIVFTATCFLALAV